MVVYRLRPEARFHDGKPMTPDDVIWSMQALRDANPFYNAYYKNIAKAEQTGDHEVTFTFAQTGNRELPLITGQLPVLPKHWWTGKDAQGKPAQHRGDDVEPPLGSGAYKADEVKPGASIRMKRVADYWGKDLPVNIGPEQFRRDRVHLFPRRQCCLRSLQGRPVRLAPREPRQELGHGL